jgi:MFS family permease
MAALAPASFAAAAFAGRVLGHRLPAEMPARRVLVVGALTAACGTAIAAAAPTIGVALGGIVVAGLGTSVCAPTLISLAGRSAGDGDTGAVVGAVTTLAYLGFLIGPALVGLVADLATLRVALAMVAGIAVALAVCARTARTTQAE